MNMQRRFFVATRTTLPLRSFQNLKSFFLPARVFQFFRVCHFPVPNILANCLSKNSHASKGSPFCFSKQSQQREPRLSKCRSHFTQRRSAQYSFLSCSFMRPPRLQRDLKSCRSCKIVSLHSKTRSAGSYRAVFPQSSL